MELRRPHQTEEGLVRLWADKALELCADIDDEEALAEYRDPVEKVLDALNHDRRVVVLGGGDSGKSTLLANLSGAPVIAHATMEGHYTCWRYICRDGDASHSRFIPTSALRGLELVDTADLENENVRHTCEQLIQGADVVLGVLDARRVEISPVWDMLAGVEQENRSAWMLVVTQVNHLDAREGIALKEHLRQLNRARGAEGVRIFIYSDVNDASATNAVRTCVQELLQESHGLSASLRVLAERTMDLVQRADRVLSAREGVSRMYSGFMAGIEQEIDNFMHSQMIGLAEYTRGAQQMLLETLESLLAEVRRSLGWALSPGVLLRLELMGGMADKELYRLMDNALQHMQEEADKQFTMQCESHWKHVRPRMKKALECEIGDFPNAALQAELQTLRERLSRQMFEPLASTGLRARMFGIFVAHTGWMQGCVICICIFFILAGILGFLGHDTPAVTCVLLAIVTWGSGCIAQRIASRNICVSIQNLVRDMCTACEKQFHAAMESLIVSRVAAYRQLYTAPRRKVARREVELRPLQDRQKTIYTRLRILLQHL